MSIRTDAQTIIQQSLQACLPDQAVSRALAHRTFGPGRLRLVAIGKAAWQMAACAGQLLGERLEAGVVVTKHGHSRGEIPRCTIYEGGHPLPDQGSYQGTQAAMDLVQGLAAEDTVIFLVSGGGSALFERPLIPPDELTAITQALLACGADIVEMNTIRKRLSAVKGGRFAQLCAPARVFSIVLSDVLGDPLDMIASGPAYPDCSTCQEALAVAEKYRLHLSPAAWDLLRTETPKALDNIEAVITGSVRELCAAAQAACRSLGYETILLTDQLCCQAKEAGSFLASIAKTHQNTPRPLAFLAGGETVVQLTGPGKGGRNQELALAAAQGIAGLQNTLVFSLGSDGTDGPTDAAGGIVDGGTRGRLEALGLRIPQILQNNDSYHALAQVDGLIRTGPTGTNVNDLAVLLLGGSASGYGRGADGLF